MLEKDPAPEGPKNRCWYCGKPLIERGARGDVGPFQGGVRVAVHFCSDACAKAYESLTEEKWEEIEDLHRAGAT